MQRLGLLSFQSNDRADVFAVQEVWETGVEATNELFLTTNEAQYDPYKVWETGRVPRITPVDVDGDTTIVQAYFRGENYSQEFYMTMYLECEMAEEVQGESERKREEAVKRERHAEVYM